LPASRLVKLRARFGQTVLVSRLHLDLSRQDRAHQVIVEDDVKRDSGGPSK
jgi:hypothetical protein